MLAIGDLFRTFASVCPLTKNVNGNDVLTVHDQSQKDGFVYELSIVKRPMITEGVAHGTK